MTLYNTIVFTILVSMGIGCSTGSLVINKPESAELNDAITELWVDDLAHVAQTGDWILSRSYSKTGDAIVGLTFGESFSHASMYDGERGTIIEAIRPVVREVPLRSLLDRNHQIVVVRPFGQSSAQRKRAVQRARSAVGAEFDLTGLFGFDDPERFYCSELLAWASSVETGLVVTPADLYEMGDVMYDSGQRSHSQLQNIALTRRRSQKSRHIAQVVH